MSAPNAILGWPVLAALVCVVVGACGFLGPDAPEPTWISLGLEGEEVRALAHTPWGLYAGTDSGGVFRHDAATSTWQPAGLADQGVINDLLYVPTVPPRLLAAVAPRWGETVDAVVFASEDGETWVPSDGGYADAVGSRAAAYSLAYDPADPSVVYVGLPYNVMQSTDGATTWRIRSILSDTTAVAWDGYIPSISVDSSANVWLVRNSTAPTIGGPPCAFVYHSTDGGLTWRKSSPCAGTPLSDVYVAPDGRLWLAGGSAVRVSLDRGDTWELSLKSDGVVHRILPAGDTLYAVSQQGRDGGQLRVFRLRPLGSHWDEITVSPGIAGGLTATLDDEGRLLVGTAGTGVWRMEW